MRSIQIQLSTKLGLADDGHSAGLGLGGFAAPAGPGDEIGCVKLVGKIDMGFDRAISRPDLSLRVSSGHGLKPAGKDKDCATKIWYGLGDRRGRLDPSHEVAKLRPGRVLGASEQPVKFAGELLFGQQHLPIRRDHAGDGALEPVNLIRRSPTHGDDSLGEVFTVRAAGAPDAAGCIRPRRILSDLRQGAVRRGSGLPEGRPFAAVAPHPPFVGLRAGTGRSQPPRSCPRFFRGRFEIAGMGVEIVRPPTHAVWGRHARQAARLARRQRSRATALIRSATASCARNLKTARSDLGLRR